MEKYKAEEYEEGTQVAPLVQFFELVHIGDTIQQMLEVYFDKEMVSTSLPFYFCLATNRIYFPQLGRLHR